MHWIAPSATNGDNHILEKRLWEAADQLRANSGLTSAQYSTPVLGLNCRLPLFFCSHSPSIASRETCHGTRLPAQNDPPQMSYYAEFLQIGDDRFRLDTRIYL